MPENGKSKGKPERKPGSGGHNPFAKIQADRDMWREAAERYKAALLHILQAQEAAAKTAQTIAIPAEAKE